ncbi:MAG: LLM class oxidoreductase [Pseudomonadota bacterium]
MLMPVSSAPAFRSMNAAYHSVFSPQRLSVGLVVPIQSYPDQPVPSMEDHLERVQLAEELGFAAVWLRDVPFSVPAFGDAGQLFDPFVYLGALASVTRTIALGVASVVLPLRHPLHVAKAAASADQLSNGRLLLGIASGDRPEEFPAMSRSFESRGEQFRESYEYLRAVAQTRPRHTNAYGNLDGSLDLLPKPVAGQLPLLVTGSSQQNPNWIARNGDGWMTYPRPSAHQARLIDDYRDEIRAAGLVDKPVMEPLYIDLARDAEESATPIHLGYRMGVNRLRDYLETRRSIGVNHVALNLRFNRADTEPTLRRVADHVLSDFC